MNKRSSHTETDPVLSLAVSNLMASRDFRLFARHLLGEYGVRQSTFTGNALSGAYGQGMQNAGLILESLLEKSAPELFLKMLKEQYDET